MEKPKRTFWPAQYFFTEIYQMFWKLFYMNYLMIQKIHWSRLYLMENYTDTAPTNLESEPPHRLKSITSGGQR